MNQIALCDDNLRDLELLRAMLLELGGEWDMEIAAYASGRELGQALDQGRSFDLFVLDMCMEGLNGIETARLVRRLDQEVPILFVTATPAYAVEGYSVRAYRYLLKPVDPAALREAVDGVLRRKNAPRPYFTFVNEQGVTRLRSQDIFYFESDVRTVVVHSGGTSHAFTGKISHIAQRLEADGFIRIHKSYVVNARHVASVERDTIAMEDGTVLPISRHRAKEIRLAMLRYMEEQL